MFELYWLTTNKKLPTFWFHILQDISQPACRLLRLPASLSLCLQGGHQILKQQLSQFLSAFYHVLNSKHIISRYIIHYSYIYYYTGLSVQKLISNRKGGTGVWASQLPYPRAPLGWTYSDKTGITILLSSPEVLRMKVEIGVIIDWGIQVEGSGRNNYWYLRF